MEEKKTHRYPTRNKSTPNIQKHQCTIFNRSFLCQGIKEFVKLKDNLKQENNPYRFAKQLKKIILIVIESTVYWHDNRHNLI